LYTDIQHRTSQLCGWHRPELSSVEHVRQQLNLTAANATDICYYNENGEHKLVNQLHFNVEVEKKHHPEGNAVPAGYCHAHMLPYVSGVNYNVNSN